MGVAAIDCGPGDITANSDTATVTYHLVPGDDASCMFTNRRTAEPTAQLTVEKRTIGVEGHPRGNGASSLASSARLPSPKERPARDLVGRPRARWTSVRRKSVPS